MALLAQPVRKWIVAPRHEETEALFCQELGIRPLVARVMANRGFTDSEAVHKFLHPSLSHLHDPRLLPDYRQAADAILGARERKEKIFIHGDYDVDGITSAALLSRFLTRIGCDVTTHVPHRIKEGYGIHQSAVENAVKSGAKLFLTCDCGGGAFEQIKNARAAGMSVVVTDHHSIGHGHPEAHAFVNPHRADSQYPFTELCGVGVAFKLCEGLTEELNYPKDGYYRAYLDLVALGTIADVMPLIGENRVLAKFGLQCIGETKKPGLQALLRHAETKLPVTSRDVGYGLGPRLNASGRIDDAIYSLELMMVTDEVRAEALATQIEGKNRERKAEQQRAFEEATAIVLETKLNERSIIVVRQSHWHAGVIGLVANKLVDAFGRPAFVFTCDDQGNWKGSARTIPNFNLSDAIVAHSELMHGGGHAMAAGCTVASDRFEEMQGALENYASQLLKPEDFCLATVVDAEVEPGEVTLTAIEELDSLQPFGAGNEEPVVLTKGVKLTKVAATRKPEHVMPQFFTDAGLVRATAFNMGERFRGELVGSKLDLVYKPVINEWNGSRSIRWGILDYCRSAELES